MTSNHDEVDSCPETQSVASELANLDVNDIKCFYSEHNQYGDWTSGYCVSGEGMTKSKFYRQLEY